MTVRKLMSDLHLNLYLFHFHFVEILAFLPAVRKYAPILNHY